MVTRDGAAADADMRRSLSREGLARVRAMHVWSVLVLLMCSGG